MSWRLLVLWLSTLAVSIFAASGKIPPDWREAAVCRRQEGNLQYAAVWDGESPLACIVQSQQDGKAVRLEITPDGLQAAILPEVGFQETPLPVKLTAAFPPRKIIPSLPILLKFREDHWTLYLNDACSAVLPSPFALPAKVFFPPDVRLNSSEPRFLPVPRVDYSTDFMIEESASNQLYPWVRQSGSWRIHTALAEALVRPETNLARTAQAPLTPDKSPNFYSLKGGGKHAVIVTGYEFFDNYHLTGSMQLDEGEAGIVFFYRSDESSADENTEKPANEDFYALTLLLAGPQPACREIRLWHSRAGQRTYLARAQTPLYQRQWYQPGIKVVDDQIIAYLDGYEVFRVRHSLPPGGKIGFYANTDTEIRFDDVALRSINHIDLTTVGDIRFQTWKHSGGFYQNPGLLLPGTPDDQTCLQAQAKKQPEYLLLGRPHNLTGVFSFQAKPAGNDFRLGLLAGCGQGQQPHYRFVIENQQGACRARLLQNDADTEQELESFPIPELPPEFQLMLDASEPGRLRFLLDRTLLTAWEVPATLAAGAVGIWLDCGSEAQFSQITLKRQRNIFTEQEQKNPIFQSDNFMRHWASPEGQWIAGGDGTYWHKGDFFGDFSLRLPAKPGSEVQVAVPDGEKTGPLSLTVKDNTLWLAVNEPDLEGPVLRSCPLGPSAPAGQEPLYILHCEGYLIWVTLADKTVLRERLTTPLSRRGTRVMTRGLGIPDLARSKVTRSNIIDEFFNESPYSWLAVGGDWQIINRFQCTPSWSHMIGEAPEGLGAFWRKQIFSGDMTLEFYAGTRHGFYSDAGNLNCTIMAADTTPSSGYSFNCTEWDHNRSQNWSRFYRNGRVIGESDAYLVPRTRKGMVRKVLNPLISEGRPIHGAWYYIKVRLIGDKLEYYFDDEKIFETRDPDALKQGLVGIWTFVHSITLAQIKITYQDVRPREFPVKVLSLDAPEPGAAAQSAQTPATAAFSEVRIGALPVDTLAPENWTLSDPVGQSTLNVFSQNATALFLRNELGGGAMLLQSKLPGTQLENTAGWFFQTKRTRQARLNFSYITGPMSEKAVVVAKNNYFHHLSGPTFSRGTWDMTGSTDIPGLDHIAPDHRDFQDVFAWIPSRLRQGDNLTAGRGVAVYALGIEQLDFQTSGIAGNVPGDGYALRRLQPIYYSLPPITIPDGVSIYARYPWNEQFWGHTQNAGELRQHLLDGEREGLNHVCLLFRKDRQALIQDVFWIKLPEQVEFSLAWDKQEPEAVRLTATAPYPDPRFARAKVLLDGQEIAHERDNSESILLRLPPAAALAAALAAGELCLTVDPGTGEKTVRLPVTPGRINAPPVLTKLSGLTPFFLNYEDFQRRPRETTRMREMAGDPLQGRYLSVQNLGSAERLSHSHSLNFSLAQYPLFQCRYRASDMAHISLFFSNHHAAVMSPEDRRHDTVRVRLTPEFHLDQQWHTWLGIISDAFVRQPYSTMRFLPDYFQLRSQSGVDQTGLFSEIHFDDLVFGPAVREAGQLTCTPEYADADGVAAVFSALLALDRPYWELTPAEQEAVSWQKHAPGQPITPALDNLSDGVCHLLFKAVDNLGLESAVSDVPFLLDRQPLQIQHQIVESKDPNHNGTVLHIDLKSSGGAPWSIDQANFQLQGRELKIPTWSSEYVHSVQNDVLKLNYPFIFRNAIFQSRDGDVLDFTLDNLLDGAGNALPKYSIPIKVDYAADHTGPSWYSLDFATSVKVCHNWEGYRTNDVVFGTEPPERKGELRISHQLGQSPFLAYPAQRGNAIMTLPVDWQPDRFPCLSFRMRLQTVTEEMIVQVVLETTDDKKYTITLGNPRRRLPELNWQQTFTWQAQVWQNFSFNVRQMFLDCGITSDNLSKLHIKSLQFRRRRAADRDMLSLDDLFIHGLPEAQDKPDLLKWLAFDASGVASLEATAVAPDGKDLWTQSYPQTEPYPTADLQLLRQKFTGLQWFRCVAKDRAGNLSAPFWLPVYSNSEQK
ncbi:MAG: hypothetical protein GX902_08305 [Lentisphaerae bacterium]|nr:hypothetical protein [Lentisphaerota bacterium]